MAKKLIVAFGLLSRTICLQYWRCSLAYKIIFSMIFFLLLECLGTAQNAPQKKPQTSQPPGTADLADSMAQRLGRELDVKTVIGEPIKVGSVTLIPIFMTDIKFGSAATTAPSEAPTPQGAVPPANLFYMSGQARPLGFVAITRKGTRFINVSKPTPK
jgi:uncharacterized spore protein YtfJ